MSQRRRLDGPRAVHGAHQDVQLERVPAGVSAEEGRRASVAVRDSGATMALAFNDLVAIGLLDGLTRARGRGAAGRVDRRLRRHPPGSIHEPDLTTAAVPHATLGEEAWQRLHALTQGAEPAADLARHPAAATARVDAVVTGS